jgi:hypothetical protein
MPGDERFQMHAGTVHSRRTLCNAAGVVTVCLILALPAGAAPLMDKDLPVAWSRSVSDFAQHYMETYSSYDAERREDAKHQIVPKLVQDLVAIAAESEVLATTLGNVSQGRENPQRLAVQATKIRRPLESFVSTIRSIDPGWTEAANSADFLNALDQLQNGKFDFVDGRIWEMASARDMKPDETRQLMSGFEAEAKQLMRIVKQLVVDTDAY